MSSEKQNRLTRFVSRHMSCEDNPYLEQLKKITNAPWITEALYEMGLESRSEEADRTSWSDKQIKTMIRTIAPSHHLEQLPEADEDLAFAMLQTLPQLEESQDELDRLQKAMVNWLMQGAQLPKQATKLHAVIFSEEEDIAIQFAQIYKTYLDACGVLCREQPLVRANATNQKSLLSIDALDGGMCLVRNAHKLSFQGAKELGEQMETNGAVFVVSYTGSQQQLPESLSKDHFFLRFHLGHSEPSDSISTIQDYMQTWVQSQFDSTIDFEGGLRGPWTEAFAKSIQSKLKDKLDKDKSDEIRASRTRKEVQRELAVVLDRQHRRLVHDNSTDEGSRSHPCFITREDLLGGEPNSTAFKTEAWKELHRMIGQQQVKDAVQSFANAVLLDHHRAMYGQRPARSGLSRLFIGPPGTGKTTVGKLYGQILCNFGLLSSGEFIYKKASDFIGPYLGHSEKQTKEILKEAKGKVLMIDEAYMLDPTRNRNSVGQDSFRSAVLGTIVEEVENKPGEDICVILAGYKDEMEHMLQHANPGLARRFPLVDAFVFEEFDDQQLEKVLTLKAAEMQFEISNAAKEVAMGILKLAKHRANFGNGGEVVNLLGRALANYRTRFGAMSPADRRNAGKGQFEAHDFDPGWQEVSHVVDRVEGLFSDMVGIDDVKESFASLARRCTALRKAGHDPSAFMPFNFTFPGPHGTGKSTVARRMASLYRAMRLLSTDEVVQTSVRDLVATRMNERAGVTMNDKPATIFGLIRSALGKTLVIDEAQQLFGEDNDQTDMMIRDVRGELTEAVNQASFSGKLVIILTGHEYLLDRMLDANPGLGSKFRTRVRFSSLSSKSCLTILEARLSAEGIRVQLRQEDDEEENIRMAFDLICASEEWANSFDLRLIANDLVGELFQREGLHEDSQLTVYGADILRCLKTKFPRYLKPTAHRPSTPGQSYASAAQSANLPPRAPTFDLIPVADDNLFHGQPRIIEITDVDNGTANLIDLNAVEGHSDTYQDLLDLSAEEENFDAYPYQNSPVPNTDKDKPEADLLEDLPDAATEEDWYRASPYEALPPGDYIRVLLVQPASNLNDPIRCKLQKYCLGDEMDQQQGYDALSYLWDNQKRSEEINCDGKILKVTPNAASAMRHLRLPQAECMLWIDAISINQESKSDRNRQVALMGQIYKQALRVFIWLGPGTEMEHAAFTRLQQLCVLSGFWGPHEHIRLQLFAEYLSDGAYVPAVNLLMKHRWWKRMWTFQEFILASHPIFVLGHLKIAWNSFEEIMPELMMQPGNPNEAEQLGGRKYLGPPGVDEDKDNSAVRWFVPGDSEYAAKMRRAVHHFPAWLETRDAMMARQAYHRKLQDDHRPTLTSHLLFKTRNREASNYRDKVYGLYYLLQASGYKLPEIDYSHSVGDIYTGVALTVLQQSRSWWLLSHLFNKRRDSGITLPSWVPDFNSRTVWHQGAEMRFKNVYELEETLFQKQDREHRWDGIPFVLNRQPQGLSTVGVFICKVMRATPSMPTNTILDHCFEDTFELTDSKVLADALESFTLIMAGWLKSMEPEGDLRASVGLANCAVSQGESQIIQGITGAFFRGSRDIMRLFESMTAENPRDYMYLAAMKKKAGAGADTSRAVFSIGLRRNLSNMRCCMLPDEMHPCRICGTTEPHADGDGTAHYLQWMRAQGLEKLSDLRYALYSGAVDHALFQTSASNKCSGHFGFVRNGPQAGDDVVLLPGLHDPIVIRQEKPGYYRIIGVSSGIVGPVFIDDGTPRAEGSFCLGTCGLLESVAEMTARSFILL